MDEEKKYDTFTVDDKSYIIKFNEKRIELYEASHKSIMASFYKDGGMLKVGDLKSLVSYGLCLEGGTWVNPKQGLNMASDLLQENGYSALLEAVIDALQRDCGFLFQEA